MDLPEPAGGWVRSARAALRRHPRRAQAAAVWVVALLAGAVVWGEVIQRGASGDDAPTGAATAVGEADLGAVSVAVHGQEAWTIDLAARRFRAFSVATGETIGEIGPVGARGDQTAHMTAGADAVWVALRRGGNGLVVRHDRGTGARRVLALDALIPDRIAVLPARVVVVGDNRVSAVPTGRGKGWTVALPEVVDVGVGYGSVWTLSRLPGARSLVTRRDPGTGRVVGRRVVPAAGVAIAVGFGAVWVANGCPNGLLRVPVGPGPGACTRVGKGPGAVAVGAGAVWATDIAGSRVAEIDPATGARRRSWTMPGRPAAVAASGSAAVAVTGRGVAVRLVTGDRQR